MNRTTLYLYRVMGVTLAVIGIVLLISDGKSIENLKPEQISGIFWALGMGGLMMVFLDILPAIFSWIKNDYVHHGITAICIVAASLIVSVMTEHVSTDRGSEETKVMMAAILGITLTIAYLITWIYSKKKKKDDSEEESEE